MAQDAIRQGIALLRRSKRVVALTGAGVSTPSGIPDFRSPGFGLWEFNDPTVVASLSSFVREPRLFFDWIRPVARKALAAQPNPAHRSFAELEARGRLSALITQNIDGLHQAAGSRHVLEVHGSLRTAHCMQCGMLTDGLAVIATEDPPVPRCDCGGVFKPDMVFFEETLPEDVISEAERECSACDLILVAGSSLEVMPAGELPLIAIRRRAKLIIVNRGETFLDSFADLILSGDVADILPKLVGGLDAGGP